jgi:hypothetical protein
LIAHGLKYLNGYLRTTQMIVSGIFITPSSLDSTADLGIWP